METKKIFNLYDQGNKDILSLNKELCPAIEELENYINQFKVNEKGLSGTGPTYFCGINEYKLAKKIAQGLPNFNGDIFICHPTKKALIII